MANRHTPGCQCCGSQCVAYTDNFNRETIGAEWIEDEGAWSIVDNELTTSDSDAELQRDFSSIVAGENDWSIKFKASEGDELIFYNAPNTDSRNWLKITVGAASLLQVFSDSVAGVYHECNIAIPADEWVTLRIKCGTFVYINGCETFTSGLYSVAPRVIGTGTISGTVYFDDFQASYTASEDHPSCPSCGECQWFPNGERGETATVTITDAIDKPLTGSPPLSFSNLNGVFVATADPLTSCTFILEDLDILLNDVDYDPPLRITSMTVSKSLVRFYVDFYGTWYEYELLVPDVSDYCDNFTTMPYSIYSELAEAVVEFSAAYSCDEPDGIPFRGGGFGEFRPGGEPITFRG